ncbi:MAG: hypothetical protein R2816_10215 [Flavobacteriaceae bacterium]|nr:hypothetical protein [Flavobacteriaceae bacterium]
MRFIIITILLLSSIFFHHANAQIDMRNNGFRIEAIDSVKIELPLDARLKIAPISGLTNKNIRPTINFTELSDPFKKKSGVNMVQKSDLVQPTWKIKQKFGEDQKDLAQFSKDYNLGELSTKSKVIVIKCRDHEYVDGDRIKLMLNNAVIHPNIVLKGDFFVIDVDLVEGYNTINFVALNEGTSSPNTAQLQVFDQDGNLLASNKWLIRTGFKASLTIYKEQN